MRRYHEVPRTHPELSSAPAHPQPHPARAAPALSHPPAWGFLAPQHHARGHFAPLQHRGLQAPGGFQALKQRAMPSEAPGLGSPHAQFSASERGPDLPRGSQAAFPEPCRNRGSHFRGCESQGSLSGAPLYPGAKAPKSDPAPHQGLPQGGIHRTSGFLWAVAATLRSPQPPAAALTRSLPGGHQGAGGST